MGQVETKVDVLAVKARDESAMWALLDSSDAIADANTRRTVAGLIMSAITNANDTEDEGGDVAEWGYIARESLRELIDCGGREVTAEVRAWFVSASRKAVTP